MHVVPRQSKEVHQECKCLNLNMDNEATSSYPQYPLSNGTMELSCFAHSIAPHRLSSLGPPKEQNAIPFLSFPQDLLFPTSTGACKQRSS